jgi:hypothetical protein
MKIAFFVSVLAAGALGGCAGVAAHQVKLLQTAPTVPYEELGRVNYFQEDTVGFQEGALNGDPLDGLREKAAALGADAVIVTGHQTVHPTTEHGGVLESRTGQFVEGIAIRYKKTHVAKGGRGGTNANSDSSGTDRGDNYLLTPAFALEPPSGTPGPSPSQDGADGAKKNTGEIVRMKAFVVGGTPEQSFGFNVRVTRDRSTKMVEEIFVDSVVTGSPADKAGLTPLTSITKIDGRPVQEFIGSFEKGSDLNKALFNRRPGDTIKLEVILLGSTNSKVVALVQGYPVSLSAPNGVGNWSVKLH